MSIPSHNYVLQQGEDSVLEIVYKSGDPLAAADLTGYSVRMDVNTPDGVVPVFTFNSDDSDALTEDEAVLGTEGEITITVDRSITLPEGELFDHIGTALPFDLFLRNSLNKQKKILKGTLTFEPSETLWA